MKMKEWGLKLLLHLCFLNILGAINQNEILIVVSYDAFRNEYFERNVTDFTNALRINYTSAPYLRNVFPTKTFPNHHSIATGVYPEEHGVMANSLYDFDLDKTLNYSFELYHFKSEIKPIWTLNEISGGHSGCMMWPGSDFDYDGVGCTHQRHFNLSMDYTKRVDEVFTWILHETAPANLIMFYIEEPDVHGHAFGPDSQVITDLVKTLNKVTEYFYKKIHHHNLENRISVVHLSDHGMDNLELKDVIDLKKIIGNKTAKFLSTTPVLQVVPDNLAETDAIYSALAAEAKTNGHFKVYYNTEMPERWRFHNKYRVGPLTAIADLGYGFQDMYDSAKWYEKAYNITITPTTKYGVHGYDNIYETMHPIFFAYGHMIKSENVVDPFDTVDLYYLFCEILGLQAPDYLKGNRENILSILNKNHRNKLSRWMILVVSIIASAVIGSVLVIATKILKRNRSNVPNYLYEEDTTILDDTKMPNYSINTSPSEPTLPSTSFQVL